MLSFGAIQSNVQKDSIPGVTVIPEVPALDPVTIPVEPPATIPATVPLEVPPNTPSTVPTTTPSPIPETPPVEPTKPVKTPNSSKPVDMSDDGLNPEQVKEYFSQHPDLLKQITEGIKKGLVKE